MLILKSSRAKTKTRPIVSFLLAKKIVVAQFRSCPASHYKVHWIKLVAFSFKTLSNLEHCTAPSLEEAQVSLFHICCWRRRQAQFPRWRFLNTLRSNSSHLSRPGSSSWHLVPPISKLDPLFLLVPPGVFLVDPGCPLIVSPVVTSPSSHLSSSLGCMPFPEHALTLKWSHFLKKKKYICQICFIWAVHWAASTSHVAMPLLWNVVTLFKDQTHSTTCPTQSMPSLRTWPLYVCAKQDQEPISESFKFTKYTNCLLY